MVSTFDKIMNLAEANAQQALGALQEALTLMSEAEQKRVLEYLVAEEV